MQNNGNIYSKFWFETFLHTIATDQTEKEVSFIKQYLPLPKYKQILDCACGPGRHDCLLVSSGYSVTGIDIDLDSINYAKNKCEQGIFLKLDMREIYKLGVKFDAVLSMWQSFGNFSSEVNKNILTQISEILNENGRLILDIYNKKFYDKHQGPLEYTRNNVPIKSNILLKNNRLHVEIDYGSKADKNNFEWELYYDYEIINLMKELGLSLIMKCTLLDSSILPHEDSPRMQLVFQKN